MPIIHVYAAASKYIEYQFRFTSSIAGAKLEISASTTNKTEWKYRIVFGGSIKVKNFQNCVSTNNLFATLMHYEIYLPSVVVFCDCFFLSFCYAFIHGVMYDCNSV